VPPVAGLFNLDECLSSLSESGGRHSTDGTMRTAFVVLTAPLLDLEPSIFEIDKPANIETLVPECSVERLDKSVVCRLAGA
jgi:hypothetical protein